MATKIIVGGSFDDVGGRSSSVVAKLATALGPEWEVINGGTMESLRAFSVDGLKVLIWMPNVSNDEDKFLDRLKPQNPEMLLIQSKRVVEKDYTSGDVIGRMLKSHSNLGIMITQADGLYQFQLLDPLGNSWCVTPSIPELAGAINQRVDCLQSLTRYRSISVPATTPYEVPDDFIDIIKRYGTEFEKHVRVVNPTRLLGNASTRCTKGFPAIKLADRILVTRRNVNKATLTAGDFVEATLGNNVVKYVGLNKPSVDTPVQLKLMSHYLNVNYMIHGHVYVQDGERTLWTKEKVPCGYLEEFDEITSLLSAKCASNWSINLRGHGCLIMAYDLEYLESQLTQLYARPFPEGI